jgi:hypothetical protein
MKHVQWMDIIQRGRTRNMSINIDFIDTLSEHVVPSDISKQRVYYLLFYGHILQTCPLLTCVLKHDKRILICREDLKSQIKQL